MIFRPIDDVMVAKIEEQGSFMASQGLRVIALAIRPISNEQAAMLKEKNDAALSEVYILQKAFISFTI